MLRFKQTHIKLFVSLILASALLFGLTNTAHAAVAPMLSTTWGQGGDYKRATPIKKGAHTYPGCTTIATAQVLYYYQYAHANLGEISYYLEHGPMTHDDVEGNTLTADLALTPAYDSLALCLDDASAWEKDATARFIYYVAVSLNAQFGGGEGSSATGKQIENAFRYVWGYNNIARRHMSVISKEAFGYSNSEWADLIRAELDAGRPVLYMATEAGGAGHAFVIDGYRDDGKVHVNFGWGGYANGYYDPNILEDPSGRRWNVNPMIFRGLEPEEGYAQSMATGNNTPTTSYTWNGNGSIISYATGTKEGYGITHDETKIHSDSATNPVVFFQWEVDGRDGRNLVIDAPGMETATIVYGSWDSRDADRAYRDVQLPFILSPARDGLNDGDGAYFVVAVAFDHIPQTEVTVTAGATKGSTASQASIAAEPLVVDGHVWSGNGSMVSYSTDTLTGYGISYDEARVNPAASNHAPATFFQWEVDSRDGKKMRIEGDPLTQATITYGEWDSRGGDVTRTVTLPYTLDPESDGFSAVDGSWFVVKVTFPEAPTSSTPLNVTAVQ